MESQIHTLLELQNINEDTSRAADTHNAKIISKYLSTLQNHNYRRGDIITFHAEENRDRNDYVVLCI